MRKLFKKQEGFALIITIICLLLMSILGIGIIGATTSNFKMVKIDSRSQNAYYIAESGVNYIIDEIRTEAENYSGVSNSGDEFFQKLENYFINNTITLDNFEENAGEEPEATVTVSNVATDGDTRDYRIESVGKIGSSKRTVSSVVSVGWKNKSKVVIDDLLLYTKSFSFQGSSIDGGKGTIVSDGMDIHDLNGDALINISTMYFNGPVKIAHSSNNFGNKNSPGTIYVNGSLELTDGSRDVYGDIRIKGDFVLKDFHIHGNLYIDGNVEFKKSSKPNIYKNLYYTGDFKYPPEFESDYPEIIKERCKKVASVEDWEVPVREISLKDNAWYINKGYEIKGNVNSSIGASNATVPDNARWLVDNYNYTAWPAWNVNNDGEFTNVVIVSKGDITINTATSFSGALIAPNGTVNLPQGDSTFNGVIVSKDGAEISGGGTNINLKKIQELFNEEDIPVLFSIPGGGNNGGTTTSSVKFEIKSAIREN